MASQLFSTVSLTSLRLRTLLTGRMNLRQAKHCVLLSEPLHYWSQWLQCSQYSTPAADAPQVCIIGTGPAGFYTAMQLIKSHPSVHVDMYEKLAVPYGLVRYGVAPDHPEVKNCINSFKAVANKDRCNFFGNVSIGKDVSVPELRDHYHAVVLASGAWEDRRLGIPDEDQHVMSARRLVGWYNGLPQDSWLRPPLQSAEHVVVVGHGNVALDVARILLTHVDKLKSLDIPEAVLSQLSSSRVRRVTLVGRRGPQHVACTIKELREMTKLHAVTSDIREQDCSHLQAIIAESARPRRRLLELLLEISRSTPQQQQQGEEQRSWAMRFLRSPVAVTTSQQGQQLTGLTMTVNRLEGDRAVHTDEVETIPCDLLLRSIGYVGTRFDPSLPYREDTGTISNEQGRVTGMPGVYAAGWAGSGPVGVIASTMAESFACANRLLHDLQAQPLQQRAGSSAVLPLLADRGVSVVSLSGASRILQTEDERGAELGKLREKITSHQDMIDIATCSTSSSDGNRISDAADESSRRGSDGSNISS